MMFNDLWSFKKFQNKLELDTYLQKNSFILTNQVTKLYCRFCLAENPNPSTHMIQAHLLCDKCINNQNNSKAAYCFITNICTHLDKFELLTKHKDLPNDWYSSDKILKSFNSIQLGEKNENKSNFYAFKDMYYKTNDSYTWTVKNVFPNQIFLFAENYLLKINDKWIQFHNGKEKHKFKIEEETQDELKLLRDDFKLFKLDSVRLYNLSDNHTEWKGQWILDSSIIEPCFLCSSEFNRIIFNCETHLSENSKKASDETKKIWKAEETLEKKHFIRVNNETWEEYCNDKLTDTFTFIGFNENNHLILKRNSKEHPDYLRFTENELFIGKFKNFIYTPVYSGTWSINTNPKNN